MSSPEIVIVDQPAVNVTVSGPTYTVTSETVGERVVEVEVPTYTVTVQTSATTVVNTSYVAVGAGSGSGNSYFPSGW